MSDSFTLNLIASDVTSNTSNINAKKSGKFYGKSSFRGRRKRTVLRRDAASNKHGNSLASFTKSNKPFRKKLPIGTLNSLEEYADGHEDKLKYKKIESTTTTSRNEKSQKVPYVKTKVTSNLNDVSSKINSPYKQSTFKTGFKDTHGIKSSLFNSNPVIPEVKQPSINQVTEDTFSTMNFSDLDLHERLVDYVCNKFNYDHMTRIQQKSIPIILKGNDTLVKSQTGSGKTLAYAIPMIQNLQAIKPEVSRLDGPLALILVPTRELASQTYEIFQKLTLPFRRIVATWIMGGEKRKSEKARIRKGVNIIVGTPGRVLDHLKSTKSFSLKNIRWLICDEADRLLDMGFENQIKEIISTLQSQKDDQKWQTVLLSATLPNKLENLAKVALQNPIRIQLSDEQSLDAEEAFAIPSNLVQHIVVVPSKLRLISLMLFIKWRLNEYKNKILVFVSCRDSVVFHYQILKFLCDCKVMKQTSEDNKIFKLHGGMLQENRQKVFHGFQAAKSGVLICTDVAARGLHLPNVDWVLQYTCPTNPVDYIHRVGRTARAGEKGEALLVLTPSETKYINILTQYNIPINKVLLDTILNEGKEPKSNTERQQANENASQLQNKIEEYVNRNEKINLQAKLAYGSFVRAYSSYPSSLKSIFHVKHLHLGHVTKSFGLNQTPTEIVNSLQKSVKYLQMNNVGKTNKKSNTAKEVIESIQRSFEVNALHKEAEIDKVNDKSMKKKKRLASRFNLMSEFGSGMDASKKRKIE